MHKYKYVQVSIIILFSLNIRAALSEQPCILPSLAFCLLLFVYASKSRIMLYMKYCGCWLLSAARSLCIPKLLHYCRYSRTNRQEEKTPHNKNTKTQFCEENTPNSLQQDCWKQTEQHHHKFFFEAMKNMQWQNISAGSLLIAWLGTQVIDKKHTFKCVKLWINIL